MAYFNFKARLEGIINCPKCNSPIDVSAKFCPNCGAPIFTTQADTPEKQTPLQQNSPQMPYQPGNQSLSGLSTSFDIKRLNINDFLIAGSTLVLFISLFLSWYSFSFSNTYFGKFISLSFSLDALNHGYMYIVLLLCLAIFAFYINVALDKPIKLAVADWQLLAGGAGANLLFTLIAFFDTPGPSNQDYGAFLGLIAAIACAVAVFFKAKAAGAIQSK